MQDGQGLCAAWRTHSALRIEVVKATISPSLRAKKTQRDTLRQELRHLNGPDSVAGQPLAVQT